MKRKTLQALAVAALGVVAIAIAAATLEDRWQPEEGSGEPGTGGGPPGGQPPVETGDGVTIPFIDEILMFLVLVLVIVGIVYLAKNYREYIPLLVGLAVFVGLLALLLQNIELPAGEPPDPGFVENGTAFPGEDGDRTSPEGTIDWLPVVAVIAILGIVLVAAIAMSIRNDGSMLDRTEQATDDHDADEPSAVAADLGAAAGRAADRIEASETYENEVYRAWSEMTDPLDLSNPQVATPGDFAAAAVDAGLAPADVRDLTRLFEAVRYGARPPTEQREERAIALLRRIEDRYAGLS